MCWCSAKNSAGDFDFKARLAGREDMDREEEGREGGRKEGRKEVKINEQTHRREMKSNNNNKNR
jgi:hypothetical protein